MNPKARSIALSTLVEKFPTPSASVIEPKSSVTKLAGRTPADPQVGLADRVGGQLNPEWVEWLQGWPKGWTALAPLLNGSIPPADAWLSEPEDLPRIAKGIPQRVNRLKVLGNGWVPQVAAVVFERMRQAACRVLVAPDEPALPVQEALFEELIDDGSLQ